MLRPISRELVLFPDFLNFEHPSLLRILHSILSSKTIIMLRLMLLHNLVLYGRLIFFSYGGGWFDVLWSFPVVEYYPPRDKKPLKYAWL